MNSVNDAPTGTNQIAAFLEDTDYILSAPDFSFSDQLDQNNFAGIIINQLPALGELSLAGSTVISGQFVSAAEIQAGDLIFSPQQNANGSAYDRFEFIVVDDGGTAFNGIDTSVSANEIVFDVIDVNDAPDGQNITISTPEDSTYIFGRSDFGFSDIHDDNDFIALTVTTLPNNGILTIDGTTVAIGTIIDTADIDAGLLSYTPPLNVSGDSSGLGFNGFGFLVHDNGGTGNGGQSVDLTENFVSFDIPGVNDPPLLLNEGKTVDEGSKNIISTDALSATDADDPPEELNFTLGNLPAHGLLTLDGTPLNAGDSFSLLQIIQNDLIYTHDGSETSEDFFDITLSDGGENNAQPVSGRFTLLINEVIDPAPEIDNESIELEFGEIFNSLEGDSLASGSNALALNVLAENSLLIISIESPPSNGSVTLNSDGTFIYQHNGSGILQDSFTYRVTNEDDVFAIATVEISVEPPLANAFEKPVIITPAEPFTPEPEPEPEIDTSTVEDIPVEESAGDSEFNFEFNAIERAAQNRTDSTELDVVLPINEIDLSDRNELFEELSTLADLAVSCLLYTSPSPRD